MKLSFEANLQYQQDAIKSITGLFEGQPMEDSIAEYILKEKGTFDKLNGQRPVEFIQTTNPFVIVDEPQNMETEKRSTAIENLKPLCTLRYSATHKNQYNLINPQLFLDLASQSIRQTWFKIPTPIGNYNPDWAIVFDDEVTKIYFVAETKDTGTPQVDISKLPLDQQQKIKCGRAHFEEFDNLEYRVVNKVGQLI